MNKMIVGNLLYRPIRSLISVVAVALEVTLILLIVGLSLGMVNDSKQRQAGIGADVVVMPPGSSYIVGLTGAPMPIKIGDVLRKLPHVKVVAPVITQISTNGTLEVIAGIDLPSYEALSPFHFIQGGQAKHIKVGDKMEILNNEFRVAGIVAQGKGARKFLQIGVLQDLNGSKDKASVFYLKLDDPSNADPVVNEIKQVPGMERYVAYPMHYYLSMLTPSNYPGLATFLKVVIGISVTIGFIVIFQAMYTAVMERTREIGILKSMGASKFYIVNVILRETLMLAMGGIILGILISLAARTGIAHKIPTLRVIVTGGWILKTTVIAILGAMLGALYPAYRAAQKDPIEALAYE
ncbi:MAG: ABC transporter permease [Acidobacteria bacterium]|nr:MAG: ABC transporter permease [Acidobacteriota bacterium]